MSDLVIRVGIRADGTSFVRTMQTSRQEADGFKKAVGGAATGTNALSGATGRASGSVEKLTRDMRGAATGTGALSGAAGRASGSVEKLTRDVRGASAAVAQLGSGARGADRLSRDLKTGSMTSEGFRLAIGGAAISAEALKQRAGGARDALGRYIERAVEAKGSSEELDSGVRRAGEGFGVLKGLIGVGALLAIGRQFIDGADAASQMDAKLRLAASGMGTFAEAQAEVRRIASGTRSELTSVADLYGAVARAAGQLGASQEQVGRATETVTKAFKVSGATQAESSAATTQLAQALASGTLRGDEFNTMMEAAPRLAKLLAGSIGVPIGQLRKMAEEGKLTSDVLFRALTDRKFTAGLDDEFKQIPATFGDAMTLITNLATTTFGAFDRGGQFSQSLFAFGAVGDETMKGIERGAEGLGIDVRATFAGLHDVFKPLLDGALSAFFGIKQETDSTRKAIGSLLGALDDVSNAPNKLRNWAVGLDERLGTSFPGERKNKLQDLRGDFERGYDNSRRKSEGETRDRWLADNMPLKLGVPVPTRAPAAAPDAKKAKAAERAAAAAAREANRDFAAELPLKTAVEKILRGIAPGAVTSTYRTAAVNRGVGGARGSDHMSGTPGRPGAYDYVPAAGMRSMTKAQLREKLEAQGLSVKQILGPGDKGHDDHFHISLAKGRQELDAFKEAAREAATAQRELDQALDAVVGKFDPATKAARDYADTLKDIDKLVAAGRLSSADALGYKLEAGKTLRDDQDKRASEKADAFFAKGGVDPKADLKAIVDASATMRESGQFAYDEAMAANSALLDAGEITPKVFTERMTKALADQTEAARRMGESAGDGFRSSGLDAAQAIAQVLGGKLGDTVSKLLGFLKGAQSGDFGSMGGPLGGVLTLLTQGKKSSDATLPAVVSGMMKGMEGFGKNLSAQLKKLFDSVFGKDGVFTQDFGKMLGEVFAGAQTGGALGDAAIDIFGIGNGSKAAKTGGEIGKYAGAAIGTAIGGPLGSAIGGFVGKLGGTLFGGLFGSAPKASGTISSVSKPASVKGNDAGAQSAVSALTGNVQDSLSKIIDALGGEAGAFSVSIGKWKDYYRVSGYDNPNVGDKSHKDPALLYDGKDAEAAVRAALANAIGDGAIKGISAAMQRALTSSADIDNAVREALKVRDVEDIIGGIGAAMARNFTTFERQAKDRLRIGSEYGFDLVKIEKRNAEDRAKIFDQTLTARVGSLKQLLDDLKFGDLFAGSLVDKRDQLLGQIDTTRKAAEAGDDGAADKLADLNRKLLDLSQQAFGTAGSQYAGDRSAAMSSAEAIIASTTAQLAAAQDKARGDSGTTEAETNTLIGTSNGLLDGIKGLIDEGNDQTAKMIALLEQRGGRPSDPGLNMAWSMGQLF